MSEVHQFTNLCKSLSKISIFIVKLSTEMSEILFVTLILWFCDICSGCLTFPSTLFYRVTNTTELAGGDVRKKLKINLIDSDCDHLSSCFTEQVLLGVPPLKTGSLATSRHNRGSAENVHNCKSKKKIRPSCYRPSCF
jgi:hypothetical protein